MNRLIEARANIDLASQNAPDTIANTGNYSGAMPSAADFAAVYGVEEGGKRYQEFGRKIDAGRQAFGLRTMPNQAIQALLSNTVSGATNSQQEVHTNPDLLVEAAKRNLGARTADPGAYVRQVFPTVDAAWKNVSNSKGYQNAILWSVSAQRQLGIEDIQPLPNSIAEDAVMSSIDNKFRRGETRALSHMLLDNVLHPELRMSLIRQLIYTGVVMSLA
ncbi:hypothetical protein MPLSOD_40278 [Mesorhizobium sp. SOD10]|nr:hypothetical protein MPLSOD_40278 [Mesorhizobium sp. SOD10]